MLTKQETEHYTVVYSCKKVCGDAVVNKYGEACIMRGIYAYNIGSAVLICKCVLAIKDKRIFYLIKVIFFGFAGLFFYGNVSGEERRRLCLTAAFNRASCQPGSSAAIQVHAVFFLFQIKRLH